MSLPSGYKRLEYIQSSGTQYIDTLVAHSASSHIVLNADVVYNTVSATNQIMGFSGNRGCGIGLSRSSWWEASSIPAATVGTRYSIEWGVNGTSWHRSVNGVSASGSRSTTAFTSNLFLFAALSSVDSTTIGYHCSCKLYGAKITVDGNTVRDYVPCINASGECGLYDKANAVFYGNAGTGTFTAGPVREPPDAPANLQHLLAVRLAWSAVDGATKYNVYRDDVQLTSTTETTFIDLTAAENTEYTYAVSAVGTGGESAKTTLTVYTKSGYFLYKPVIESATFQ